MSRVSVRLPDELADRLRHAASERQCNPSDVVRDALLRDLDGEPLEEDPMMAASEILARLLRDARRGSAAAAREYLEHARWLVERHEPDAVDEMRARLADRRNGHGDARTR
jgi:Arc/MetJ-type ribon-helix-helix transcriptional regulator